MAYTIINELNDTFNIPSELSNFKHSYFNYIKL